MNEMAGRVAQAVSGLNYKRCKSERELEDQIIARLDKAGIKYQRQFVATKDDRFDILVDGGIVLELKIKGGAGSLLSQIERYAQLDCVTAILVVTTRASHLNIAGVKVIHGKKVGVIHVGWL